MALGPLYATIPAGEVGVPYSFTVDQSVINAYWNVQVYPPGVSNLTPYTFHSLGPSFGFLFLVDLVTGLAIPGMSLSIGGVMSGTPTTPSSGSGVQPLIAILSAPPPIPPPLFGYGGETLIVNGWHIFAAGSGNRSYPM